MHIVTLSPETVYQALSDLVRLRVVRLLASTNDEACLCEFVDSLLEPEYKVSRHLKALKSAGILTSRREGRWVYCRLVKDSAFLKKLYKSVEAIPDPDGIFKDDLASFQKRLLLRKDGRCQTGIRKDAPAVSRTTSKRRKRARAVS